MKKDLLTILMVELMKNAANPEGAKFDLRHWYDSIDGKKPISCGTTACAFGLAALIPAFKKLGLKHDNFVPYILVAKLPKGLDKNLYKQGGKFRLEALRAASVFFGITPAQAGSLFLDCNYSTQDWRGARGERAVAARIGALLAGVDITSPSYIQNYDQAA